MALPSPCNGLCSFERRTGFCIGCARTRDEIVGWRAASDEARDRIGAGLAARRSRLGFVHRLPWTMDDVGAFLRASFAGAGTWVTGVNGAIGAFRRADDETAVVDASGDTISARTGRAAMSFKLSATLRAYAVNPSSRECREWAPADALSDLVVIAVARRCGLEQTGRGLARLGADAGALLDGCNSETLYDFGLGDCAGSFGLRTADRTLMRRLDRHLGDEWPVFFPALRDDMIGAAPTRVVRSPLGRVEVSTPLWSGTAASGPFTQFLPLRLKPEIAEPALEMADSYLPCAVHHPAPSGRSPP